MRFSSSDNRKRPLPIGWLVADDTYFIVSRNENTLRTKERHLNSQIPIDGLCNLFFCCNAKRVASIVVGSVLKSRCTDLIRLKLASTVRPWTCFPSPPLSFHAYKINHENFSCGPFMLTPPPSFLLLMLRTTALTYNVIMRPGGHFFRCFDARKGRLHRPQR